MLSAGVPLKVTQGLLGHSTISTTADLYTHVAEQTDRDAAISLDAYLAPFLRPERWLRHGSVLTVRVPTHLPVDRQEIGNSAFSLRCFDRYEHTFGTTKPQALGRKAEADGNRTRPPGLAGAPVLKTGRDTSPHSPPKKS
jgi:hypothetical protein